MRARAETVIVRFGGDDGRTVLDEGALESISAGLAAAGDDPAVRVAVLLGRGRVFALGADVAALRQMSPADVDRYLERGQQLMTAIRRSRLMTIAAVNGLALGGGLELALACDVRWAHRRAAFALPECTQDLLPAWGATRSLREAAPASVAMEMLCGERLTAGRAFEVGLVSRVFEGPRFEEEVTAGAEALARRGGAALRGIVELWRAPGAAEEHRALERRLFAECLSRRPTR